MNVSVTAKRLLGAVAAFAAITSSALAYTSTDSFESYADGADIDTLGSPWSAHGDDLSEVVASNYTYTATTFPISGAHSKVLKLNTEGKTITNTVDNAQAVGTVYVDTMVNFVPSEDAPTVSDTTVQTAVYLNADKHVCVLAGNLDTTGAAFIELTGKTVNVDTWHRLTITMDYESGDNPGESLNRSFFKVAINGVTLTSDEAYAAPFNGIDPGTAAAGIWFIGANQSTANREKMSAVNFQGTGGIDDFVVTTSAPNYGGETPLSQWLAENGIDENYDDGDPYSIDEEFIAGLDPTVGELYEITSFSITEAGILTLTYNGADSPNNLTVVLQAATVGGATTEVAGTLTYSAGVWTFVSDAAVTGEFFYLYASDE